MSNLDATTPQLELIKKFHEAHRSRDIGSVAAVMSKNYTYQTFPKSTDLPDETRDTFVQKYGGIFSLLTKVESTIHEAIEAPGKVILHLTVVGHVADGTTLEYDSVSILTLVEEDGELKILGCKDFSDPEKRSNLHSWVANVLEKGGHAV